MISATAAAQSVLRDRCRHPGGALPTLTLDDVERSIGERFDAMTARFAGRPAIKTRARTITYGELRGDADRVACALADDRTGAPVALLFEDEAPFVTASLGALKAGRIQVPLEPTVPPAQLRSQLAHARPRMILADRGRLAMAHALAPPGCAVLDVDAALADGGGALPCPPAAAAPAVIEYTSGSTGEPKGILRSHRAVLHDVWRHTRVTRICADDRLLIPRLTLSAHLRALLNGAAFYPLALRPDRLAGVAAWMAREEVTVYRSAVSAFRAIAHTVAGADALPHLRVVMLYGEPIHRRDVDLLRDRIGAQCLLIGTLGAAELGDYAHYFVGADSMLPDVGVPGGFPAEGVEVLLLDDAGGVQPPGEPGELAVRSRHLASGYWERPDLTAAAFLADPEGGDRRIYRTGDLGQRDGDGCLVHLGRKDRQVKVNGSRVQLPEVEAALRAAPGIKDAAVLARDSGTGATRLVGYVVPKALPGPTVGELRRHLGRSLAPYMIPSRLVVLDALPLTATGKLDRRALPAPGTARPDLDVAFAPPRTPIEEVVAAAWAEVLEVDRVGIHDDFVALGGDSLLATQVVAAVIARLAIDVPAAALLSRATVAEMADEVVLALLEQDAGGRPALDGAPSREG